MVLNVLTPLMTAVVDPSSQGELLYHEAVAGGESNTVPLWYMTAYWGVPSMQFNWCCPHCSSPILFGLAAIPEGTTRQKQPPWKDWQVLSEHYLFIRHSIHLPFYFSVAQSDWCAWNPVSMYVLWLTFSWYWPFTDASICAIWERAHPMHGTTLLSLWCPSYSLRVI